MLQRPALMALAAALLLGGCQGIYDNTKGWANRLEASILDATESEPEAAETAPEAEAAAPAETTQQAAAMTPLPRPDGTPQPILIDPADKRPSDGLLLDSLPSPTEPAPLKEAAVEGKPAGDEPAEAKPAGVKPAEAKTAENKTGVDKAAAATTLAETRQPPLPPRKPELPAAAVAAKTEDAPAAGDDHAMVLHLSSLRSEDAAKREWSDLQGRYPEALAGMQAEFRRTELGEQGTFYRVLAGPLPSDSAAKDACAALKAKNAKQYCRVLPPKPKS